MWDENTLGTQVGDQPGDYPMPTNPQTPGAFGNVFNQITQSLNNSGLTGLLGDALSGRIGGQLGQLATFGGLGALLNQIAGQQKQQPVGYQGGIPQYTATRQQMPYVSGAENEARRLKQATLDAISTGATLDQVAQAAQRTYGISTGQIDAAMRTEGPYRRPGLGGITYFTPMQYQATGQDLARPSAGQITGPSVGSGGMELPPAFGLPDVGVEPKRRPMAAPSNIDMRSLGESAVNAIRGGQSLDSVIQTAEMKLGIPASTVRQAIAMQGGVASNLGMAEPPAVTGVPRGQRVAFGPGATVTGLDVISEIRAAYDKAGLPQDRSQWTREHQRIATDINNQVQGFGPYERLIFDPNTGGVNRPDPQLFSTLEPERKAEAESFLKAALPNAVELIRRVNTNGWSAAEKLIQDYRLSLDDMSKLMSPKDFATLKREIDVGNLRYKEPGRGSYYGAITTQTPTSSIGSGFSKTLERLSASDPKKAEAFRGVMGGLNVYGQGIESHQAVPTFTLQDLGVPEYYHRGPIKLTYADVLAAETSNNPNEYYQQLARTRAAGERSPLRTIKASGDVDGIPVRVVPTRTGSYTTLGDMVVSNPKDLSEAVNAYGLKPKDLDKLEDVFSAAKQQNASNLVTALLDTNIINAVAGAASSGYTKDQIYKGAKDNFGIPDNRIEQALNSDTADKPIAMAVRDSLGAGFTMDQVYKGAKDKFGISKERVDEALRSMNMAGTDISGADVIRMARENLPPPGAAAGGRMQGGIAMLAKGRYLKGNGDGVSDDIPAKFVGSGQPAALADGEFVIPARVVSEIGNGSSDAGARKLYAMLDRVEARARKSKRGKPSGADRELNKLA